VLAVLGAAAFVLSRDVFPSSQADGVPAASAQATRADSAVAMSSALVTVPPNQQAASSPPPAKTKAPAAHPSATASAGTPAATTAPTKASPGTSATKATPASTSTTEDAMAEAQVLALINQARATAGLPALTVTAGLTASSSAHNALMAAGCGLSHQCPGEAAIGDRETAAGVHWTACGENIGEGGPVSDTAAAIAQMAVGLTQSMLDEQPPDDGHRMNILSTAYTHIGIAVYRDSSGTVWLTQDFSN